MSTGTSKEYSIVANKDFPEESKYKAALLELDGVMVLELYVSRRGHKWFLVKINGDLEWRKA